jgi:sugar fermentation stimulation protein A
MEELLVPGSTRGWVVGPLRDRSARTHYDLVVVRDGRTLVSIDSRIANRLVGKALAAGLLRSFGSGPWRAEVPWHDSRFDFGVLSSDHSRPEALLEVKSSNLKVGSTALFPDAPTLRGAHHLNLLATAARTGTRAGVIIAVQREDVTEFQPNRFLDPNFGRAWDEALDAGVQVQAWTVGVRPEAVHWGRRLRTRS